MPVDSEQVASPRETSGLISYTVWYRRWVGTTYVRTNIYPLHPVDSPLDPSQEYVYHAIDLPAVIEHVRAEIFRLVQAETEAVALHSSLPLERQPWFSGVYAKVTIDDKRPPELGRCPVEYMCTWQSMNIIGGVMWRDWEPGELESEPVGKIHCVVFDE